MNVNLTRAEVEALLRAIDLARMHVLARNRREGPRALRLEDSAEEKLLEVLHRSRT